MGVAEGCAGNEFSGVGLERNLEPRRIPAWMASPLSSVSRVEPGKKMSASRSVGLQADLGDARPESREPRCAQAESRNELKDST